MKHLGIDFGSKRVGISFGEAGMAFPVCVFANDKKLLENVHKLCQDRGVEHIVVGDSKDFSMKDNPIMAKIRIFVEKLKEVTGLPISYQLEFLTSVEAERFTGKNDMSDASAATIILQTYLDKVKN